MPELPEVEVARRALEEHCVGKKVVKCSAAADPKVIDGVSPERLEAVLLGKTVTAACRKGKNLWLVLDSPPFPSFQFGMTGAIYIKGVELAKYKRSAVSSTEEWPSKYSKLLVELDDGLEFSFTDKRRFAKVRLLENPESVPPISELGPDALFEPMPLNDFVQSLSRKNVPIKALLLDQSFMAGIGNWVSDEVLYQARIHPMQSAAKISKESCGTLHRCIQEVIEKALQVGADSSQFPADWIFHSREKKAGAFVDDKKVEFITIGGRTSAYVPELQKLDGSDTARSRSKRSKAGKGEGVKKKIDDNNDEKAVKKAAKKPAKAAASSSKKATDTHAKDDADDDDEEGEDEAKPGMKRKKSLSKKAVDTNGDEEEDGEGEHEEEAKPVKRGRKQPVKAAGKRGWQVEGGEEEEAKPAKKGSNQPGKAPKSSKKAADTIDNEKVDDDEAAEDEEELKQRGRKQPGKMAASSSIDTRDDDDEEDDDVESDAKQVKRGRKQPAKAAKSSSKVGSAARAKKGQPRKKPRL